MSDSERNISETRSWLWYKYRKRKVRGNIQNGHNCALCMFLYHLFILRYVHVHWSQSAEWHRLY